MVSSGADREEAVNLGSSGAVNFGRLGAEKLKAGASSWAAFGAEGLGPCKVGTTISVRGGHLFAAARGW